MLRRRPAHCRQTSIRRTRPSLKRPWRLLRRRRAGPSNRPNRHRLGERSASGLASAVAASQPRLLRRRHRHRLPRSPSLLRRRPRLPHRGPQRSPAPLLRPPVNRSRSRKQKLLRRHPRARPHRRDHSKQRHRLLPLLPRNRRLLAHRRNRDRSKRCHGLLLSPSRSQAQVHLCDRAPSRDVGAPYGSAPGVIARLSTCRNCPRLLLGRRRACPGHLDCARSVLQRSGSPEQARRRQRDVIRNDRNPL